MGRLFIKFYSLFIFVVAVYFFSVVNLDNFLEDTVRGYLQNTTRGSFALLENRLLNVPEKDWPDLVSRINAGGGYPVELQVMTALSLAPDKMDRLIAGDMVYTDIDDAIHCYKRVAESQWVIRFPFGQSSADDGKRLSKSTFNLIEMALSEEEKGQWPGVIRRVAKAFSFPVILEDYKSLPLSSNEVDVLREGDIVAQIFDDKGAQFFYHQVKEGPFVIRLGPFDEPLTLSYLQSIMMFFLSALVALAVLFWVFPLWRDLKLMTSATNAFGRGDFSFRAKLRKRSVLSLLAKNFNAMAEKIQQLISSHKELTNAVSHELRTPLARLRFSMEMLASSVDEKDRLRYLESMNNDVDELDKLVGELLTYARFDRVKPELIFKRQKVHPWLKKIVDQASVGENTLTIDFDIFGHDLRYAYFEPKLMGRAVGNLLQNAKRYAHSWIGVFFIDDKDQYRIIVDDDGPGVPENDRNKIFEAFKRLDPSRGRDTGGYGLGLSIVQRICQWHDGDVQVERSSQGGARFIMTWKKLTIPNK